MTTIPQAVTERYVSNLIHYGRNKEFDIVEILRRIAKEDGPDAAVIGVYFTVLIHTVGQVKEQYAAGATISQAVRRALEKHGVTFR